MNLRLGSVTTIVASSPETAKEILQKHDQTFSGRTVPDVVTVQPNPEGTLAWTPGDQRWRNRRRICTTQMFNNQSLDSLQHLRHEKVRQLIAHIRKHCEWGRPVDIGQLAFATTLNLVSNTIFSTDMIDQNFNSAQEFKDLVWRIMEDAAKPNLSDYFPILRRFDLQGVRRHILPAYRRMHEIFDDIIGARLKARASDKMSRTDDFLDALLDQCEGEGSDFNLQNIKPLILDLFIAGSDTSAITTEWAMAELLRNPQVMHKARNELVEVVGTEQSVKESDVGRLPYLQAVVKETLRLHPAAPLLLPYKAQNDVEVCGFTIPKGSKVCVNGWAISRDETYWEDPFSFLPERFMGSKLDYRGQDFEYIPFGAGRRICTGLPLAVRMVHLMLASLVHSFNWKLPVGTNPHDIDMTEQFGVTLKKAIPLHAIAVVEE
jgi:cytochrome P450